MSQDYQVSIVTIGSRVRKIRSMALLAFIPKSDKNSDRPFGGPVHGPHSVRREPVVHPRDIGSDRRAVWLLIRHLSSSGTFRASYDASIWPAAGIVRALRRNSVSAPILRLADAQSAPSHLFSPSLIPRIFPLLFRECRARILAKLRLLSGLRLWLAYKSALLLWDFQLTMLQKWVIYLQAILVIYNNRRLPNSLLVQSKRRRK